MSTAASLPFFLFILPAGALADMTERKKMLYAAYIWLALSAGGLAVLGWLNLLDSVRPSRLSVSDRDGVRVQRTSLLRCGA